MWYNHNLRYHVLSYLYSSAYPCSSALQLIPDSPDIEISMDSLVFSANDSRLDGHRIIHTANDTSLVDQHMRIWRLDDSRTLEQKLHLI